MRGAGDAPRAPGGAPGPWVFLSAGEASGDRHAARVARELAALRPDARLFGLGGAEMAAAGVELLATLEDLAVMGYAEVLRRLPFFLGLRRRVRRALAERDTRLVIPVDYPGFNLPLARRAHAGGIPVLYYIAPQVWAWRAGRARHLAEACDRVLTVLPFEADALAARGVDARFVGHPLLDEEAAPPDPDRPSPDRRGTPVLGLFPGSRRQEIDHMLPPFVEAGRRLAAAYPGLDVVAARPDHLPAAPYEALGVRHASPEDVLSTADAAITKSGTVTLELALRRTPMVVGYRTSRLTYALARRVVKVPSIALVNLVAGEPVVPELLQDALSPDALVREAAPLLDGDAPATRRMRRALTDVRVRLGTPGCARRVAGHAAELLAAG